LSRTPRHLSPEFCWETGSGNISSVALIPQAIPLPYSRADRAARRCRNFPSQGHRSNIFPTRCPDPSTNSFVHNPRFDDPSVMPRCGAATRNRRSGVADQLEDGRARACSCRWPASVSLWRRRPSAARMQMKLAAAWRHRGATERPSAGPRAEWPTAQGTYEQAGGCRLRRAHDATGVPGQPHAHGVRSPADGPHEAYAWPSDLHPAPSGASAGTERARTCGGGERAPFAGCTPCSRFAPCSGRARRGESASDRTRPRLTDRPLGRRRRASNSRLARRTSPRGAAPGFLDVYPRRVRSTVLARRLYPEDQAEARSHGAAVAWLPQGRRRPRSWRRC